MVLTLDVSRFSTLGCRCSNRLVQLIKIEQKGATNMKNIDIAHEFFYGDFDSQRNFNNVSYANNLFYSYSTVIGTVVKSKFGNYVLLVSENSMTPTTARHIGNLIRSCPYPYCRVPMRYGERTFSIDRCIDDIVSILENYTTSKLALKVHRDKFIENYKQLIYINDYIQEVDSNLIEQFAPTFALLNNTQEVKRLKALLEEKAKQDEIKAKEELNTLLRKYNYLDLVQFAYDNRNSKIQINNYQKSKTLQNKVKKVLNPFNDLSFVWIENDDTVKTSQNIRMTIDIVKTGLKLWKHNKVKHGYKIGGYTVLEIREDYVQIGCHKILIDNLKALYQKLFEDLPTASKDLQVA